MNRPRASKILKAHIATYDTQAKFAESIGVSNALVSRFMSGGKPIPNSLLASVGLEQIKHNEVEYKRLDA